MVNSARDQHSQSSGFFVPVMAGLVSDITLTSKPLHTSNRKLLFTKTRRYYGLQITGLFFRREAAIAFVHTTILEMLQIPRKLSVEKADKRQETYDTPL